jgi:hypothetical protein
MTRTSTAFVLVAAALLTAPVATAANGATPATRALMIRSQALDQTYQPDPSAQAVRALTLRSEALNRVYHRGSHTLTLRRQALPDPSAQAVRALTLRGQALNRVYHLGSYANPSQQAIHALSVRSQALDRTYKLGPYTDGTGSSFPWDNGGIVGAAALGAILVGFAAAVGVRKRRTVIAV